MAISYTFRKDAEWFPVPTKAWCRMACCDCGLVHRLIARVSPRGRVFLSAVRDEQESTRVRRRYRRQLGKG